MPQPLKTATKTSVNSYASVFAAALRTSPEAHNHVFQLKENNVNAVTAKILGSNDGTNWEILDGGSAEYAVLKNGSGYYTLTDAWVYLDVHVKSTVEGSHGSLTVSVSENI